MATGRNDICPCGSGHKYKNCCINKDRPSARGPLYALLAIAVVGIAIAVIDRKDDDAPAPAAQTAAVPTTPRPQPPGPVPAGKVWSAEHGHWHDANAAAGNQPTRENPITMTPRPQRNVPQPPGPVPAGKVWSPEHGHWHTKKSQ